MRQAGTTSTKRNSAARSSASCEANSIARSSIACSGRPAHAGQRAASSRPTRGRRRSVDLRLEFGAVHPPDDSGLRRRMRIAVAADERTGRRRRRRGGARATRPRRRSPHGALNDGERDDWAWASEAAARDVAEGRAEQGVVCCWTGTGASIAANKVDGVRAALCGDAATAAGARQWNDANVLALSLRTTSEAELGEILDAWFDAGPSDDARRRGQRRAPGRHPVIALNARAAARPELGGVERWARELAARLPGARRLRGHRGRRPRSRTAPATPGSRPCCPSRARRARLLLNPANLAPLAFPRNAVVIHDAAALRDPDWYSPRLRALAAHDAAARSRSGRASSSP